MLPIKFQDNQSFVSGEKVKKKIFKMAVIWIFHRNNFSYFFNYKSPQCFLPSFKSIGLSVQERKQNRRFSRWRSWRHLAFPIRIILISFDLQVTPMLPTKFQVNWPFGSGEELKNRFSRWDRNNFSYFFYLPVAPMLPTKFLVYWPFGSGEEAKNRF